MATSRLGPKTRTRRARRERARGPQPAVEHGLGRVQRLAGNRAAGALVAAAGPDVQRVIAANYQYMSTGGKPPRFDPRFAFKHLLNQDDSDTTWLANTNPLDSKGERVTAAMTNTSEAYAQAMNRFNTPAPPRHSTRSWSRPPIRPGPGRWCRRRAARCGTTRSPSPAAGSSPDRQRRRRPQLHHVRGAAHQAALEPPYGEAVGDEHSGIVDHWDQSQNPLF